MRARRARTRRQLYRGPILTLPPIFPTTRDAEAGRSAKLSPGGRFENSPAVHCRVEFRHFTSPVGTAESSERHASVPIPIYGAAPQPSLRDLMPLLHIPTLERVGY